MPSTSVTVVGGGTVDAGVGSVRVSTCASSSPSVRMTSMTTKTANTTPSRPIKNRSIAL